jgi:hypothetical protein
MLFAVLCCCLLLSAATTFFEIGVYIMFRVVGSYKGDTLPLFLKLRTDGKVFLDTGRSWTSLIGFRTGIVF